MIGTGPMFGFDTVVPGGAWPVVAASAIGLVVGIEAALLSAALYRIEDIFHRLPFHWMWWPAIGGVAVGLGGLVDAHVLGPGYASIQALLDGSLTMQVVIALLAVKAIVWLIARGSGTSVGVLAPLLSLGGGAGTQSDERRVGKECVSTF